MVELGAINSRYPSGSALATALAAMMVPAPGRFSTTKLLPSRCSSAYAIRRAIMSAPARRERHDDGHWMRRVVLRLRSCRHRETRDCASGKAHELSAMKPHRGFTLESLHARGCTSALGADRTDCKNSLWSTTRLPTGSYATYGDEPGPRHVCRWTGGCR